MDACAIAANIVNMADKEHDQIDHLKLQRLCYYAQGHSVVLRQMLLFDDPIEAWEQGPVVPAVYRAYEKYGAEPIPPTDATPELEEWRLGILDIVYQRLGWMTTWNLCSQTHMEQPWREVRRDSWRSPDCNAEITPEQIHAFFHKEMICQYRTPETVPEEVVRDVLLNNLELAQLVAKARGQPSRRSRFNVAR